MNPCRILRADAPGPQHREAIVDHALARTRTQIQVVCRHYVEESGRLGLSTSQSQQLLRFGLQVKNCDVSFSRALFMHPCTQYWLAAMRRCSADADAHHRTEFVDAAGSLAYQLDLLNGVYAAWSAPIDGDGGLRLFVYGRHLEFGAGRALQPVEIECVEGGIRICFVDDRFTIELPESDLSGVPGTPAPRLESDGFGIARYQHLLGGALQLQRRDEWLRPHWTGTNQRRTGTEFFGASAEQYPSDFPLDCYREAINIVERSHPEMMADIATFTPVIVPRRTGRDKRIAFTVLSRQGAMFIDPEDPRTIAENLVHENAHVKLRYMQFVDPILEDFYENDEAQYMVSWRPDPRPLPGILEGAYVFMQVLALKYAIGAPITEIDGLKRDIETAFDTLERHANFTPAGRRFFDQLCGAMSEPANAEAAG